MKDEMSQYAGVASSYKDFPLSALRHLQSILSVEIETRLESFGEYSIGKSVPNSGDNVQGSVAEVGAKETVFSVGNVQEKNVLFVNFKRGDK